MKALAIARKEVRIFFSGPGAWVILALWSAISGWMFTRIFEHFLQSSMFGGMGQGLNLNDHVFAPTFNNACVMLLFMVPIIPVRLFSDEKRLRTFDLLMTSPLTATEIVIGKYLAGLFITWAIVSFVGIYPIYLSFFGSFELGPVLTGLGGLYLMGAVYIAVGLFASSLTESPFIAWFVGFIIDIFLWVIGWAAGANEGLVPASVYEHLSIVTHFGSMTKGTVETAGLIYFGTLIVFFCFLTHRVVESARWR